MAKRKFRIVKRENNIPVLGVCEYCNAEFTADPETICRPQDGHTFIQKQFIAHKCKRRTPAKTRCASLREGAEIVLSTSRIWDAAQQLSQSGVAVEKLLPAKFAKIKTRQDALQTTFSVFLDIFYPPKSWNFRIVPNTDSQTSGA